PYTTLFRSPACSSLRAGRAIEQARVTDVWRRLVRLVPQAGGLPGAAGDQRDPRPRFRRPEGGRGPDDLRQGRDEEISTREVGSMPTFRPASRGSWTPSVGAESG